MLHICHSHRLETLAERLGDLLARPTGHPLAPETVVVQHPSMGRWLNQVLAARHGIAANIDYRLPGAFVWDQLSGLLGDAAAAETLDRAGLHWRCMTLLPALLDAPQFEPLRAYLRGRGNEPLRRYRLAARLADFYDRCLVYRQDWIQDWETQPRPAHWQAALWRAIVEADPRPHRAALTRQWLERCTRGDIDTGRLPPRVAVFAPTTLPPVYLDVLAALGQYCEVHVLVLNPCLAYWGDIVSRRNLARLREGWRARGLEDVSALYTEGHPLLASWGRVGRDFTEALHERAPDMEDAFPEIEETTLLQRLQGDILELRQRGEGGEHPRLTLAEGDRSLRLHACHGPMREVQVLHDTLLGLFAAQPDLRPGEVVVMAPDIDAYAPYLQAVFAGAQGARHIPWSVADRRLRATHPIHTAFAALLALPDNRLGVDEVMGLLDTPAILRRRGLDAGALERLQRWVREVGVRWGLDGRQRAAEGLGDSHTHSWRFGIERLLAGYASAVDDALLAGVAPYAEVEGGAAEALGPLIDFIETLAWLRTRLGQAHPLAAWREILDRLLDLYQADGTDEIEALSLLRAGIDALLAQAALVDPDGPLDGAVVREHLRLALDAIPGRQGFLAGGVNCCSLVPLRSIPFRVVCLLGINDADFPRRPAPAGFDLIAQQPRRGDRSPRDDDRYLLLEALLSAREALHISYVGRSPRDGSEMLPSVLVTELLDVLASDYGLDAETMTRALTTLHPLTPFSERYGPHGDARSYAQEWLAPPLSSPEAWFAQPLPPPDPPLKRVELEGLLRFFRSPARELLRQRFGVYLDRIEVEAAAESEPFCLDPLQNYTLRQAMVEGGSRDDGALPAHALMAARGVLPHAGFGVLAHAQLEHEARDVLARLEALAAPPLPALEIDLRIGGLELAGWLRGLTSEGLLDGRASKVKPTDRLLLWIRHLALNAQCPQAPAAARHSRHVGLDATLTLSPLPAERAHEHLATLLALYQEGLTRPLPWLPKTSTAWWTATEKGDANASGKARAAWEKSAHQHARGESEEPEHATLYRGVEPFTLPRFEAVTRALLEPLYLHLSEEKA